MQNVVMTPMTLAQDICAEHEAAQGSARDAVAHAIRAGELLIEAKAALAHGEFAGWLAANVTFGERHARRYMQLAELDPAKRTRVSDLSLRRALGEVSKMQPTEASKNPDPQEATSPEKAKTKKKKKKTPKLTDVEYRKARQVYIDSVVSRCTKTVASACENLLGTDELQMLRDAVNAVIDKHIHRADGNKPSAHLRVV